MKPRRRPGQWEPLRACLRVMAGAVLLAAVLAMPTAAVEDAAPDEFEFVERVVATVDGDPIMASEIARIVDLDLVPAEEDEDEWSRRSRVLDLLIGERLRFHRLEILGLDDASADDALAHLALLRRRYPSYRSALQRVGREGIGDPAVRQLVAHQVMTLTYVEELLGPRAFISEEEIEAHYLRTYRARSSPPLEEVRQVIRETLGEERLVAETEAWTAELRAEAEIVGEFDLTEPVAAGDTAPDSGPDS